MAFIDELKKSAVDLAGKAKQKTTKITGITKINLAIKSNESKLASVYEEIGRLFYLAEREGTDNTEAIATAIMKADKYNADIELAKRELAELRAVKTCDECGKEIDRDFAFCNFCGAKQEIIEPEVEEETEEEITEIAIEEIPVEEPSDEE
ncbi:MAG: hypothetical protein IKV39_01910 [Clostridia bacterium]|nr:hypothetical protein [Clostridia bacterium]